MPRPVTTCRWRVEVELLDGGKDDMIPNSNTYSPLLLDTGFFFTC